VTLFDGRERSFPYWEEKYVARAYQKDIHQILDGTLVLPKFGTDYDTVSPPDDPMEAIIEKNLGAYCDLVNAIDTQGQRGRTAFTLVTKTKTPIYPNENAYEGFKNLQDKYRPSSELDRGELVKSFYSAELHLGTSAEDFIMLMETQRQDLEKLGTVYKEEEFLHNLLNSLGKSYADLSQQLARTINAATDPLAVEKVRKEIKSYLKRIGMPTNILEKKLNFTDSTLFGCYHTFKNHLNN
jgi:hypothetical protein